MMSGLGSGFIVDKEASNDEVEDYVGFISKRSHLQISWTDSSHWVVRFIIVKVGGLSPDLLRNWSQIKDLYHEKEVHALVMIRMMFFLNVFFLKRKSWKERNRHIDFLSIISFQRSIFNTFSEIQGICKPLKIFKTWKNRIKVKIDFK